MHKVTVHHSGTTRILSVSKGTSLLQALHQAGLFVDSPCNGRGTCGKCRVQVHQPVIPHSREERMHLSAKESEQGIHLSCSIHITADMEITLHQNNSIAAIMTDTSISKATGSPVMQKQFLSLSAPSLQDQLADAERLLSALAEKASPSNSNETCSPTDSTLFPFQPLPLDVLQKLPEVIRENHYQVTTVNLLGQPAGIESGDTTAHLYGIAVDIGTTTLAAYLYDLNSKEKLSLASSLNPQKKYGSDVISRIDYASKSNGASIEMAALIRNAIIGLIDRLVRSCNLKDTDIYLVVLAGNTTMLHLLLALPALHMAAAPFIPVTQSSLVLKPCDLNFSISPHGRILLLPSVSAYVGADAVAAVLSCGMHRKKEVTLLVDIGTNGEMVLGNERFLYACSTAAGPAFEGANITCGTGGIEGAICEVAVSCHGLLQLSTIGEQKPVGICGSGLIDAIACMLHIGILDETGRILDRDELDKNAAKYADSLLEVNGQPAFRLTLPDEINPQGIYITQKDIREVQNAKAAIAAGIKILVQEAGFSFNDISSLYLAGGFGSFMQIESAIAIGLLPKELSGRILAVGNAAGAGTILSLLSSNELITTTMIAKKMKYLELSSRQDFVYEYTENMFFPME